MVEFVAAGIEDIRIRTPFIKGSTSRKLSKNAIRAPKPTRRTTAYGNAPVPYDTTDWMNNITFVQEVIPTKKDVSLQVGIHDNLNSRITVNTGFSYDLSYLLEEGIQGDNAYDTINNFLLTVSSHATKIGAVSNQLESALDSVSTDISNISSSLSTIKDSDIGEISSKYIQQQILQQASATLFASANQSPSIALQLI